MKNPFMVRLLVLVFCFIAMQAQAQQFFSVGRITHIGQYLTTTPSYPAGKTADNVVGFSMTSDKRVFTFFDDHYVCVGDLDDLCSTRRINYYLPRGTKPKDVVGIAFTSAEFESFTWYKNQTYSEGNHYHLYAFGHAKPFSLPSRLSVDDIVDMAIHLYSGKVYTWYRNGQYSIGTPDDLDAFQKPEPYAIEQGYGALRGLGFYHADGSVAALHRNEVRHRIAYTLGEPDWLDSGYVGIQHALLPPGFREENVIAISAYKENHQERVVTWYNTGEYSVGSFNDLAKYGLFDFELQVDDYPYDQILDIGVSQEGLTYTYLNSGIALIGEMEDISGFNEFQFMPAGDESRYAIFGIGANFFGLHQDQPIRTWYNDNHGTRSIQTSVGYPYDLGNLVSVYPAGLPDGKRSWDVLGVGLIQSGYTVTYYRLY